jgi:hypothetical protein
VLRKKIKFDDIDKGPQFSKFHTPVKGKKGESSMNLSVRHSQMQ